jgi:hypothetical protein
MDRVSYLIQKRQFNVSMGDCLYRCLIYFNPDLKSFFAKVVCGQTLRCRADLRKLDHQRKENNSSKNIDLRIILILPYKYLSSSLIRWQNR